MVLVLWTLRDGLFIRDCGPNLRLLVLQTGSQLFTGNAAIMAIGAFERRLPGTSTSLISLWSHKPSIDLSTYHIPEVS